MNKPNFKDRKGEEAKEYQEEVIQIDRVTRVVKGGRRLRFRATVVIGNKKGKVGIGTGKANEVTNAIQKAVRQAKKNVIVVPMRNETIPHDIKIKFGSAKVLLMPASKGTGIIAGGPIRKVIELAGVKNILSKALGGSNKLNNAKATFEALKKLPKLRVKEENKQPQQQAPKQVPIKKEEIKK